MSRRVIVKNKLTLILMAAIILLGCALTLVLFLCQVTSWSWITGYLIGSLAFVSIIPMIGFAARQLVRTENIYYYLLLFLIRVGVIFVPFLFAIYFPDIFSIFGVLIALAPFSIYFLMKFFTDGQGITRKRRE